MKKSFFKNSNTQIISLAVLSLVVAGLYAFSSEIFKKEAHEELNPFVASMPLDYVTAFEQAEDNDSKLFHTLVENSASKELLIFRRFPKPADKDRDFIVTIFPKDTEKFNKPIQLDLTNNGVLYNYKNSTYAVFRKALPLITVERVAFTMKDNKNALTGVSENNTALANPYLVLFESVLKENDLYFIPSTLEKREDSLVQRIVSIENYVASEKVTIGTIAKPKEFWSLLDNKDVKVLDLIQFQGSESEKPQQLLNDYLAGNLALESFIGLEKLARFEVLRSVFTNGCSEPLYLRFANTSGKLEPLFVSSKCLGKRGRNSIKQGCTNNQYLKTFARLTDSIIGLSPEEAWMEPNKNFEQEVNRINSVYPTQIFDVDILGINQRLLGRVVHGSTLLKPELISITNRQLMVTVENVSSFSINLNALNYKINKRIVTLSPSITILPGKRDTVSIDLPRSFENLFVHKKAKKSGFKLEKDIYDLQLIFSVEGTTEEEMAGIRPYQPSVEIEKDLFRDKIDISAIAGVSQDKNRREITFQQDSITLSSPLIIPEGYMFKVSAGTTINIVDGGKIISNGPLKWIGTKQQPIRVISSDQKGQGILVLSGGKPSFLEHTTFTGLTNPKHGNWSVTGAVTFYESPVFLEYVTVQNNRCEDALNIVRTNFTMDHCKIAHTQSDGFDGDFVQGDIINSEFSNLGNDGIDVSGSQLTITNVTVSEAGDKGLSAGEDSKMKLKQVVINNSEIGIAGKDLSYVTGDGITINNNKLAFTAFKKKPEFGPSNIKLTNVSLNGIETEHLIEDKSSLIVNGELKETIKNVKSKMYGVEFGRSSKETRNSQ